MADPFEVKMVADVLAALDAGWDNYVMLAETQYFVGRDLMGVTVASARRCDDGITHVQTRYFAGLGGDDLPDLLGAYQGFWEPPSWWSRRNFDRRH